MAISKKTTNKLYFESKAESKMNQSMNIVITKCMHVDNCYRYDNHEKNLNYDNHNKNLN